MQRRDNKVVSRLSRAERIFLFFHRSADRYLSPLGVWVFRRTKGAVAKPWKVDALLLTTTGRKSGKPRTVVLQFFRDGDAMIVAAANDGGEAHPGWYFNLTADPVATVEVEGIAVAVRAEELRRDESAEWWQRIVDRSPEYERYERATERRFPIMRLVRQQATTVAGALVDRGEVSEDESRREGSPPH